MLTRPTVAGFLQGLFVLPLCALFGGLIALLFHARGGAIWGCVAFCALFPVAGAIKNPAGSIASRATCWHRRERVRLSWSTPPPVRLLFALLLLLSITIGPTWADSPSALRGFVVCLDPGHSSETSQGTESRDHKLTELHVNWIVGQRLKALLEGEGATVILTKTHEPQVVTNRRRAEIANAAHAGLFLRLHCDSGEQSGLATYYPDRAGTRFGVTGPSAAVIAASRRAALIFHPAVITALAGSERDAGIKGDSQTAIGGKQGALTGSIFSRVPALTVEMCVLTNGHDYRFIRTPAGAETLWRGRCSTGVEGLR